MLAEAPSIALITHSTGLTINSITSIMWLSQVGWWDLWRSWAVLPAWCGASVTACPTSSGCRMRVWPAGPGPSSAGCPEGPPPSSNISQKVPQMFMMFLFMFLQTRLHIWLASIFSQTETAHTVSDQHRRHAVMSSTTFIKLALSCVMNSFGFWQTAHESSLSVKEVRQQWLHTSWFVCPHVDIFKQETNPFWTWCISFYTVSLFCSWNVSLI